MGRDKALLKMPDGQTLLARAEALLAGLRPLHGIEFLTPRVSRNRPGAIADCVPGLGPLGGLYSMAEYLRRKGIACHALLAIPADMPLLSADLLERLCAEGAAGDARALCYGRCYLPLWLSLERGGRDYLRGVVAGEKPASIKAMLGKLGGRQLEMPSGDWHRNINHPHEFEEIAGLKNITG